MKQHFKQTVLSFVFIFLGFYLLHSVVSPNCIALEKAIMDVNFNMSLGDFRHLWIGSDIGYIDTATTPTMTKAMCYAHKAGFRYIRFHDPIVDSGIYSEDANGNPVYNWENFDRDLDAILSRGFWPILVLETMPKEIANYDGGLGYTNPYPPNGKIGYLQWQQLVYEIVTHCREKWGNDIHNWYFEVWNEPDAAGYFKGTLEEYLKIYDHAVAGATAADPKIKIGGPAGGAWGWVEPFLNHCNSGLNDATGQKGTRVDFLSWHIYTVTVGLPSFVKLEESLRMIDEIINKFPRYEELPILITEWGCSDSEHPVHDRPYDAAFKVMAIRMFMDHSVFLALPYGLSEGPYGQGEGFRGGLGLFTKTAIPKPSFRAMQLLQQMVGERIECESDNDAVGALVCLSKDEKKAWLLLYDLIEDYNISYETEITVRLNNFPEGNWQARATVIAPGGCDPFLEWEKMGKPQNLSEDQYDILEEASKIPPAQSISMVNNTINITLKGSSVMLIELSK